MRNSVLPDAPRRVLLVRLSSLGDVICAMPLAMGLRARFPGARLLWAVEPDAAPLLRNHESGAEAILVPRVGGLRERSRSVATLRSLAPDLVVDAQGNAKSGTVARLAARGAPILGYAKEDVREWSNLAFSTVKAAPSGEAHTVRRSGALLAALGAAPPGDPPDYGLVATEEERAGARALLAKAGIPGDAPVVLLHPGKLRDVRTWTAEGTADLARSLRQRGWSVVLEGPDPKRPPEARALFAGLAAEGVVDLTDGLPLRTLLGLVAHLADDHRATGRPHRLVSPDTLLPHLAAALGLPVVLLAGPQDPARTGPLGAETRVVDAWEGLPCAPCRKRRCHYEEERACMRRIDVYSVLEAVTSRS